MCKAQIGNAGTYILGTLFPLKLHMKHKQISQYFQTFVYILEHPLQVMYMHLKMVFNVLNTCLFCQDNCNNK